MIERKPKRTAAEMALLERLVVARKKGDPELSAAALGRRLNASHVTVLAILRKHGLATPPKARNP